MKKLLVLCAVAVISVSNLFAFTNIVGGGIKGSVPEILISTNQDPVKQMTLNNTGLNLMYIGCFNSGLSIKESLNYGIGSVRGYYMDSFATPMISPITFTVSNLVGVGYAIIHTENLYLGAFVNAGAETSFAGAFDKHSSQGVATCLGLVGGDVTAVFTPGRLISIFASVSANVGFGGTGGATISGYSHKHGPEYYDWDVALVNPTFVLIPTIGIAFKF